VWALFGYDRYHSRFSEHYDRLWTYTCMISSIPSVLRRKSEGMWSGKMTALGCQRCLPRLFPISYRDIEIRGSQGPHTTVETHNHLYYYLEPYVLIAAFDEDVKIRLTVAVTSSRWHHSTTKMSATSCKTSTYPRLRICL